MSAAITPPQPSGVLVCGLGRLGQHCVATLALFGVPVHGVDANPLDDGQVAGLPALLASFSIGDCRAARVLEQASIATCRAVLLVTHDERINIAAAFAVRALHPHVRIVIRSGQENLNELLAAHLGNFVAYEPSVLAAPAFALAALADDTGNETAGLFRVEERLMRVVRVNIVPKHPWCGAKLGELNTGVRRVVGWQSGEGGHNGGQAEWMQFQRWDPETRVRPGDAVACMELEGARGQGRNLRTSLAAYSDQAEEPEAATASRWERTRRSLAWTAIQARLARFWVGGSQLQRVAISAALVLATFYGLGALFYWSHYRDIGWRDALNVGTVLVLGGYDNLFGSLRLPFPIPVWLHVYSVFLSVSGTVGVGILYAFLTERVLSVRFQLRRRRATLPRANHIVLVGTGPIGDRIAAFLLELQREVIVLDSGGTTSDPGLGVPYVSGTLKDAVEKVRLRSARGLVALGSDEVANLEAALVARATNPRCRVVIRSDDTHFSENVAKLVAGAQPLGVYALAAEAFVTAAFGESVHSLLRIAGRTGIVTEYVVTPGDTLLGRLVGEVGYGYGVIPILFQRAGKTPECFPSDDTRLHETDRLVVLATTDGLRDVEYGRIRTPTSRVRVESAASKEAGFEGAIAMVRISGCDLATAQAVVQSLPATLEVPMYEHQAERLVRELGKVRVVASRTPVESPGTDAR
jgi:Trk K+ transport system NAD-binding subunit